MRVLGLESGTFRTRHRPGAPFFGLVGVLGGVWAKVGLSAQGLNGTGTGIRPPHSILPASSVGVSRDVNRSIILITGRTDVTSRRLSVHSGSASTREIVRSIDQRDVREPAESCRADACRTDRIPPRAIRGRLPSPPASRIAGVPRNDVLAARSCQPARRCMAEIRPPHASVSRIASIGSGGVGGDIWDRGQTIRNGIRSPSRTVNSATVVNPTPCVGTCDQRETASGPPTARSTPSMLRTHGTIEP